jgi:putative ABC transport system permease protein
MKYFLLVWAGLWRKPVRTILTILSVAVAFLLFGALRGVTSGMDALISGLSANRLRVQSRAGFFQPLPLALFPQIQSIPGVTHPGYVTLFSSYYRERANSVVALAMGGEVLESKPPEFKLAKAQRAAFDNGPTAALVGARLAQKYGWKIGDRVSLNATSWTKKDGSATWTFDIAGIYDVEGQPETAQELYFHYDYLDQERTTSKGTVNLFVLNAADPAGLAATIDRRFANSADPTSTQSDREWVRGRMKQAGDLNFMVNAIVGAALFTLLFLTGNTMMQSVRERTPEVAVLKTVGFSDGKVAALVMAEGALLCLVGALLGLTAARLLFIPMSAAMQTPIKMPPAMISLALSMALGTGIVSALIPCWRARQLSVVDALAGR